MPYQIKLGSGKYPAVNKQFEPEIDMDRHRELIGTRPMTHDFRNNLPKKMRVTVPTGGAMPHILGWTSGPFVIAARVRDIIEHLEPGTHEFHPVELTGADGGKLDTYYLVLPPPQLDAVVNDETDWGGSKPDYLAMVGKISLRRSVVAGHHFWRGVGPLQTHYFCSNELRDRIAEENLIGWDLRRKCTLVNGEN